MSNILSLDDFLKAHSSDTGLCNMAGTLWLQIQNQPFSQDIWVLDGREDFASLDKGYYLRIMAQEHGVFHLYGVEVMSKGNYLIHENIPEFQLSQHKDTTYLSQLLQANKDGLISYRQAKTLGGGFSLHEDLVLHYAQHGSVGTYQNLNLGALVPKKVKKVTQEEICPMIEVNPAPGPSQKKAEVRSPPLPQIQNHSESAPKHSVTKSQPQTGFSYSIAMSICSGILAWGGLISLIVGALAMAAVITTIAPPLALGLVIGGSIATAISVGGLMGMGIFSHKEKLQRNQEFLERHCRLD